MEWHWKLNIFSSRAWKYNADINFTIHVAAKIYIQGIPFIHVCFSGVTKSHSASQIVVYGSVELCIRH